MAATDSRSKLANPITQHSDTPRLVESQPMLDPITEPLEADPSVVCIVPNDLRGLPAVVPFVEGGGEVPAGGPSTSGTSANARVSMRRKYCWLLTGRGRERTEGRRW